MKKAGDIRILSVRATERPRKVDREKRKGGGKVGRRVFGWVLRTTEEA